MTHCRQQMFPPVFVSHLADAESLAVECVVMLVIGLYVFYKRQDSFILDI